jgi:hypothetical protein
VAVAEDDATAVDREAMDVVPVMKESGEVAHGQRRYRLVLLERRQRCVLHEALGQAP